MHGDISNDLDEDFKAGAAEDELRKDADQMMIILAILASRPEGVKLSAEEIQKFDKSGSINIEFDGDVLTVKALD